MVIDRLSDVMHNSRGEMFSPMFLENKLKFSPYIKEVVVFGDKQDFIGTLINIDPIVVGKWAEDRSISCTTYMDLSSKPEVAELMRTRWRNSTARLKNRTTKSAALRFCTSCSTWTTANSPRPARSAAICPREVRRAI